MAILVFSESRRSPLTLASVIVISVHGVKKKPPDPVFHGFDLGGPGVKKGPSACELGLKANIPVRGLRGDLDFTLPLIPRVAVDCGS